MHQGACCLNLDFKKVHSITITVDINVFNGSKVYFKNIA